MIRTLVIFVSCFALGAVLALVARAALHRPDAGMEAPMMAEPTMVPAASDAPAGPHHHHHDETPTAPPASADPAPAPHHDDATHAQDGAAAQPAPSGAASASKPINTICPVCGFEVDAGLPVSLYRGHVVGFGCLTNRCKVKFDADPERYGPAALANKKAE